MILETLEWLTTPCPPAARRLGYLGAAIALAARHNRHRTAWKPHLDATRRVILDAIAECVSRRRVVVLGSGPLFDIPLEELAAAFKVVELVDFVHLRSARRAASRHRNVVLRSEDITGLADRLLAGERSELASRLRPPRLEPDTDLVISANLLSQLPDLPSIWLRRRHRLNEEERTDFCRAIVHGHFDWLTALPARVCLIAETRRAYVEPDGAELRSWDALFGLTLPPGRAWTWDLAPAGEHVAGLAVRNTVCGIADLRRALAEAG